MRTNPFTRPTIVAAIEFLEKRLTQAQFDQLVVRLGLDDTIALGPAKSVTAKSAVLAQTVTTRGPQVVSTLDGPVTLAEAAVREAVALALPQGGIVAQDRFQRGLALDGYSIAWSENCGLPSIRAALPHEVDLPAADDEVHQLLKRSGFDIPLGHLDQAIDAHTRGDWAAANSQIRAFLEGLLAAIAERIDPRKFPELATAENRRAWLAERGFLSVSRNEWSSDGKNFMNGLFRMLHTEGSHPGLSDEDHSTFRLHLGLITGRTLLRRFAAHHDLKQSIGPH